MRPCVIINCAFLTQYERDAENGLDYAQARYYSNSHGRFTGVDPLMASAEISNPQTLNRYSYVLNNPIILVDPTGLVHEGWGDKDFPKKACWGCSSNYPTPTEDKPLPKDVKKAVTDPHILLPYDRGFGRHDMKPNLVHAALPQNILGSLATDASYFYNAAIELSFRLKEAISAVTRVQDLLESYGVHNYSIITYVSFNPGQMFPRLVAPSVFQIQQAITVTGGISAFGLSEGAQYQIAGAVQIATRQVDEYNTFAANLDLELIKRRNVFVTTYTNKDTYARAKLVGGSFNYKLTKEILTRLYNDRIGKAINAGLYVQ